MKKLTKAAMKQAGRGSVLLAGSASVVGSSRHQLRAPRHRRLGGVHGRITMGGRQDEKPRTNSRKMFVYKSEMTRVYFYPRRNFSWSKFVSGFSEFVRSFLRWFECPST
jgi:hypothetical protein